MFGGLQQKARQGVRIFACIKIWEREGIGIVSRPLTASSNILFQWLQQSQYPTCLLPILTVGPSTSVVEALRLTAWTFTNDKQITD